MKSLQMSTILQIIDGEVIKGSYSGSIDNVTLKSRGLKNRTLFFDLFKSTAINFNSILKSKSSVIVTDKLERFKNIGENITLVKVKKVSNAFWKFVDYYRAQFNIPVIGVTGTCGKTTTKEMIKHILSSKYSNIVATYKSNNQRAYNIKYLMQIDDATEIAAIEMGITFPEDLSIYCRYFKPQIGVVTNIGVDHLDRCKTLGNYIRAKSKLLDGMDNKGTLILNADSENIKKIDLSNYKGKVIYFGFNEEADFIGHGIREVEKGINFILKRDNKDYKVFIPVKGQFNVYNALGAIAATYEAGIKIEEAIERLKSFNNIERHFQIRHGINGCLIIDDTWSSNPTSAAAAIRMLKSYSEGKKTVAILGRMTLLGEREIELHRQLGEQIAELGINNLVTIDDTAKYIGMGAVDKGMSGGSIYNCSDLNEIMSILNILLDENTIALVKTDMFDSCTGLMEKLIREVE